MILALVLRDLWPDIAGWLNSLGLELPAGANSLQFTILGKSITLRYATTPSGAGGAR